MKTLVALLAVSGMFENARNTALRTLRAKHYTTTVVAMPATDSVDIEWEIDHRFEGDGVLAESIVAYESDSVLSWISTVTPTKYGAPNFVDGAWQRTVDVSGVLSAGLIVDARAIWFEHQIDDQITVMWDRDRWRMDAIAGRDTILVDGATINAWAPVVFTDNAVAVPEPHTPLVALLAVALALRGILPCCERLPF